MSFKPVQQIRSAQLYREDRRWRLHTSWRWPPPASCPQSLTHLWRIPPLRPCWRGPSIPPACVWCSRRWQSGWRSRRCRRTRPTCPGRNLAGRPSGTPAARNQMRSCAADPAFCDQARDFRAEASNNGMTFSGSNEDAPHLVSSCRRVLISQIGLVAVMAVKPGNFRKGQRFRQTEKHPEEHRYV